MALVRDDLGLTRAQVGNTIIASVAITMVVRLAIGWLCDRIGPRSSYTGLLVAGSIPVMTMGLAQNYETRMMKLGMGEGRSAQGMSDPPSQLIGRSSRM